MSGTTLRIGLTGGIGSGKSTVASIFSKCGAIVIDADAISRQVTAPGGIATRPVAEEFGAHMIRPDGAMDRDLMRQLVFDDQDARRRLEAIIHPLVRQETVRQYKEAAGAGSPCVIFDLPLLVESGRRRQQLDQVVVVDCSEATQIRRVIARSGLTSEAVEKIIKGQASREQRLSAADVIIHNEGISLEALDREIRQLAARFGL